MEQVYDMFVSAGLEHLANIEHHLKRIADHICGPEKVNIPLREYIKPKAEVQPTENAPVEAQTEPVEAVSPAEGTTAPRGGWKKALGSRRWKDHEKIVVVTMRRHGCSWEEIGRALARTAKSCEDYALLLHHAGEWPAEVKRTVVRQPRV